MQSSEPRPWYRRLLPLFLLSVLLVGGGVSLWAATTLSTQAKNALADPATTPAAEEQARRKKTVSVYLYALGTLCVAPIFFWWLVSFLIHWRRPFKTQRDRILEIARGAAYRP